MSKKFTDKQIEELKNLVDASGAITAIVHTRPDGDAVGSGLGLISYLREKGKDAALVFPDETPSSINFIFREEDKDKCLVYQDKNASEAKKNAARKRLEESDLLFYLDFNSEDRTGPLAGELKKLEARKVMIDHHLYPEASAVSLCVSTPEVSSTCELLYFVLKAMEGGEEKNLGGRVAECLLTGVITDTNNFANSVFEDTLGAYSELLSLGADREWLFENLYQSYGENRLRLLGRLLDRKLTVTGSGLAVLDLDRKTIYAFDVGEGDTEGFVNLPLMSANVKFSVFLKEDKDRTRVSIRSKKGFSANRLAAEYFSGGGHEQASGGRLMFGKDIKDGSEALAYTLKAFEDFMKKEKA